MKDEMVKAGWTANVTTAFATDGSESADVLLFHQESNIALLGKGATVDAAWQDATEHLHKVTDALVALSSVFSGLLGDE